MPAAPGESSRVAGVQSPIIPIVGQLIRDNPGTISLGQGVVFYGPPPAAIEALSYFASEPLNHRYGPVDGIQELREIIGVKLERENGIRLDERARVVVTAGGNMAFMNAVLAITSPGDEVILPVPFYFNHEMALVMASCRAVPVPTTADFQLDPERIRSAITPRTRAVVTVSPNNPSGAVYSEATLREVNRICAEAGIYHVSDEAYEYFTYGDAEHFSPGSAEGAAEHTISLFSLSKAYGFASWRIGYMVLPERLVSAVHKIQDTIVICPPVVSQVAAVGALTAGVAYCREQSRAIADSREIVLRELGREGSPWSIAPAAGALYLLMKVDTALDDTALVTRLVREHRVAAIPGSTFGLHDGCYLRISYGALEPATVGAGVERLVTGLRSILTA